MKRFCKYCGQELKHKGIFCDSCGKRVGGRLFGFRSNRGWKKILSVIYLVILSIMVFALLEGKYVNITVYDFLLDKLSTVILLLWMASPYIFLSETKFRNKIPLFKKHSVGASIGGMAIISVAFFILIGVINGLHSKEYQADMENHAYVEVSSAVATCEEGCSIDYRCEYCGTTKTEKKPALGHEMLEASRIEATCESDGKIVSACKRCGKQSEENISALGHTMEAVSPTLNKCKNCGKEEHAHKWEDATCESPSTCNGCNTTRGSALGHTTDCGVCERCNKELRKQSPVTILDWTYNIDYVGGVEWNFKIKNNTNKQIKYVTMQWSCYNAVGDLVRDEITWKTYVRIRFTGPLDAYATSGRKRNTDKFYNHDVRSYKMTEIIVEYMDGTKEEVTNYHDNILG